MQVRKSAQVHHKSVTQHSGIIALIQKSGLADLLCARARVRRFFSPDFFLARMRARMQVRKSGYVHVRMKSLDFLPRTCPGLARTCGLAVPSFQEAR